MNKIQKAAYQLIQADARFINTLVIVDRISTIETNYFLMSFPYIGIFTDGAEQWCRKMHFQAPTFSKEEKAFYSELRLKHKLLEKNYEEYISLLMDKFQESDTYFYKSRSLIERFIGYYNVGVDLCNGNYCGNTVLCAMNNPLPALGNSAVGLMLKDFSVIAGRLASSFGVTNFPPYAYDETNNSIKPENYHFFNNCPIKEKTEFGFLLFSILCNINYATVFIEHFFTEEIPQKFKFSYLQYYYLCTFVNEINRANGTNLRIDNSLYNTKFRNCIAHYGLGQFMKEEDILFSDPLKGLTIKAFGMDYKETKRQLFMYLNDLCEQIKILIF